MVPLPWLHFCISLVKKGERGKERNAEAADRLHASTPEPELRALLPADCAAIRRVRRRSRERKRPRGARERAFRTVSRSFSRCCASQYRRKWLAREPQSFTSQRPTHRSLRREGRTTAACRARL